MSQSRPFDRRGRLCWWPSPAGGVDASATVVCCVYVRDFDERAELQRVLRALMALMAPLQVPVTAGFKPDAFTMLGIDGKQNRWRLPPTVHSVAEALAWDVAPAPPAPGTQQDPIELDG